VVKHSKSFVRIYVDGTKKTDEGRARMARHGVSGFPTVVFLDADGRELDRFCGLRSPDFVAGKMAAILEQHPGDEQWKHLLARKGEPWDSVRALLVRLGDYDLDKRDSAAKDLLELQRFLRMALRMSEQSADPEVRARARRLAGEK